MARSGAQTFTASGAARGEYLTAAGGRKSGTEAVTALAHQFAGLISPLHGSFSADRAKMPGNEASMPDDEASMPDNEVSPVMLAGPKRAVSGPDRAAPGRTGSSRTIGAAYTGATRCRQLQDTPVRPILLNVKNR